MTFILSRHLQATQTSSFLQLTIDYIVPVLTILLLLSILLLVYLDRNNGYPLINRMRNGLNRGWVRVRGQIMKLKKKKSDGDQLGMEEQPSTSKSTLNDFEAMTSEKTYVEADLNSIQETANTTPSSLSDEFRTMQGEVDSPQINLSQMFQKEQKNKNKAKEGKKSKSKLRGRVQIKKSQLQAEANEEENACDISQDLQVSQELEKSKSETEA